MNVLGGLAILALASTALLVPAASADNTCTLYVGGRCLVDASLAPSSAYSWCFTLLVDPPFPGTYYYAAGCTPNFCAHPHIRCPGEPPGRSVAMMAVLL